MTRSDRLLRPVLLSLIVSAVSGHPAPAQLAVARAVTLQDTLGSGLGGTATDGDSFGLAVATGDFDGDGFDDLAAFDRESAIVDNGGAVRVLYGGSPGLGGPGVLFTDVWPPSFPDGEPGDEFGAALTAGDFDGDGFDDLAIGIPGDDVPLGGPNVTNCGAVLVLFGSEVGLTAAETKLLPTFLGDKTGARFGAALAAGDFDGDGYAELVVGAPGGDVGSHDQAGVVSVFKGDPLGFWRAPRHLHQDATDDSGSVSDVAEPFDRFGWALAVGNFNGDVNGPGGPPVMDLAVGAPGEGDATAGTTGSGLVHLFYGNPFGTPLGFNTDQAFHQGSTATGQTVESGDSFGAALAAGDLTGDGRDDLAVGAPAEDVVSGATNIVNAGLVTVVRGATPFVTVASGSISLRQDDLPTGEIPETDDYFGATLAIADFDGDGFAALLVGAPLEDVVDPATFATFVDAGSVTIAPGGPTGFPSTAEPARLLARSLEGHPGALAVGDLYGSALAAGDFDGDDHPDLVVGAPGEDATDASGTAFAAGAIVTLPGSLFCDGFAAGSSAYWSDTVP